MEDSLIDKVAWVGKGDVRGPIRAVVLRFAGLGNTALKPDADSVEMEWADAGALIVAPYHNPWAWMNQPTRDFVDELVDGLFARYDLHPRTPIISSGASMGGHGALLYTILSRHKVSACYALCPVCDLPYHYTERPDLPRTMHSAFGSYGDIHETLIQNSVLHQVAQMPDIPYLIIHGLKDEAVGKLNHSDPLVAAMRVCGLKVDYKEPAQMQHCWPFDWPLLRHMTDFVLEHMG